MSSDSESKVVVALVAGISCRRYRAKEEGKENAYIVTMNLKLSSIMVVGW